VLLVPLLLAPYSWLALLLLLLLLSMWPYGRTA
jgi:hypothetical protein